MQLVFYVKQSGEVAYVPCVMKNMDTGEVSCATDVVEDLEHSQGVLVLSGCMNMKTCEVALLRGEILLFKNVLQEHFPVWARVLFPEHMCV